MWNIDYQVIFFINKIEIIKHMKVKHDYDSHLSIFGHHIGPYSRPDPSSTDSKSKRFFYWAKLRNFHYELPA